MGDGLDRRDFLKLVGASAAAPVVGCASKPVETIIPYLVQPEEVTPGTATYYATVCRECPAGCGMIIRTREGRAVKAEGNPKHPVSNGRLCARGQASLQGLYNPDRIRQPLLRNSDGVHEPVSWTRAEAVLAAHLQRVQRENSADQVTFISGQLADSTFELAHQWLRAIGSEQFVTYEPFGFEATRRASEICFGTSTVPVYDISEAGFLLSFNADFLDTWHSPTKYAGQFSQMHGADRAPDGRFVQVESRMSLTGANADEWIAIKPGREAFLALALARLILPGSSVPLDEKETLSTSLAIYTPTMAAEITEIPADTISRLAAEFGRQGKIRPSVALAGGIAGSSSEETATLVSVNLLNYIAGNIAKTVYFYDQDAIPQSSSYARVRSVVQEMQRGNVPLLMLAHSNPVFSLPESVGFDEAMKEVDFVVSFSSFLDESTKLADLILPDHTPLESWGDSSPEAGVLGLMQPVMEPIFDTKALGDTLLSVSRQPTDSPIGSLPWENYYSYLRAKWQTIRKERQDENNFETFWHDALQRGGIWSPQKATPVRLKKDFETALFREPKFQGHSAEALILIPYPSTRYYDGRGANKPWLHELPDPMSQAVWGSWIEIHPETARTRGISEGDLVSVNSPYGTVDASVHLYSGVHQGAVAMPIGLGHSSYGRYAEGLGQNPCRILAPDPEKNSGGFPWLSTTVELHSLGQKVPLITTDGDTDQHERGIAQTTEDGTEASHGDHVAKDMYPAIEYEEYRWGMSIDLSACTGCGACVTACYAENNIPVVGKDMVAKGREMSWLRIDRFFESEEGEPPETRFAPMLCQHCGNAPCEPVCPVYATYHNPEGLNAQIYNRCVGTRYCANNCSYKVRRFNWDEGHWPEPLNLQLNPDVTIREPGVMEKCSFCVQRIQEGKGHAKDENRQVQDGDITPACAQTCPTQAITFGNLKDKESEVARKSQSPRGYTVFESLNTKPAITYMKKIKRARE